MKTSEVKEEVGFKVLRVKRGVILVKTKDGTYICYRKDAENYLFVGTEYQEWHMALMAYTKRGL